MLSDEGVGHGEGEGEWFPADQESYEAVSV